MARALGVEAKAPAEPSATFALRSLEDVLFENAREGCANETYAALVATHQAGHAPNARLRAVFASIAADEREHAMLAYRIHAWGLSRFEGDSRRALEHAFTAACDRVTRGGATPLASAMGEPPPALAAAAFSHVVRGLAA